jgi:hypothetical protein
MVMISPRQNGLNRDAFDHGIIQHSVSLREIRANAGQSDKHPTHRHRRSRRQHTSHLFPRKDESMKALLLYPEFPDKFWRFRRALKFIGKRAKLPPLGLLTVAAMLPEGWGNHIVDVNVRALRGKEFVSKDTVLISAMIAPRVRKAPMPTIENETTTSNSDVSCETILYDFFGRRLGKNSISMIVVRPAREFEYLIYDRQSAGWLGSLVEDVR